MAMDVGAAMEAGTAGRFAAAPGLPRLNPFAFPSQTDFRFAQLVAAVLGATVVLFAALYDTVAATPEGRRVDHERCVASMLAPIHSAASDDLVAHVFAGNQCTSPDDRTKAIWIAGGTVLLALVAGAIFVVFPAWKVRRGRLAPLGADDAPEVVAALATLSREAGLLRPPAFLWNPLNATSSGVAFGRRGRYSVALSGGLVVQFWTDPAAFRAVVFHELAHLRNGDVDKTYLAIAASLAFLVVALVPFLVSLAGQPVDRVLQMGWRSLALAALVAATLCAVLRARESYADARASLWDGPQGALRRVLAQQRAARSGGWWRGAGGLFKMHPEPAQRVQALDDTRALLDLGFWEALAAGVAATVALQGVDYVLALLPANIMARTILRALGPALIFAPLATGVVGLGVWRATFAALGRGEPPRRMGRLGLGLGLGFLLGQRLSFATVALTQNELPLLGPARLAFGVIWSVLLLVGLTLLLRWIAAGATVWLEVAASRPSPKLVYPVGLAIAGCLLAGGLMALSIVYLVEVAGGDERVLSEFARLAEGSGGPIATAGAQLAAHGVPAPVASAMVFEIIVLGGGAIMAVPPTFLAIACLWAYPLAAWFWLRRPDEAPAAAWVFLDPSSEPRSLPRQAPLRPGFALALGAAGGTAAGAILVVTHLAFWSLVVRDGLSGVYAAWTMFGQPLLAVVAQAGLAGVVAGRVRRLPTLHGLFASFVAGSIMAAAALGFALYRFGAADTVFLAQYGVFCLGWVNGGALLALPVTVAASALAHRPVPRPDAGQGPCTRVRGRASRATARSPTAQRTPVLLREGKVRVRHLITHRTTPDQCQVTYERAVDAKDQQLGVIFDWA